MNMRAVFIHFLGDSLSSLLVLAVALMLKYLQGTWLVYADPVSSLFIVALTLYLTVPLVREVHRMLQVCLVDGWCPCFAIKPTTHTL